MRAGGLRSRVTIRVFTTHREPSGQVVQVWEDGETIWAEVKGISGRELMASGGGGFKDKPLSARNHPPPQIFTHGDFFENKTRWKREIFMARPPKPPAYLDELAAQQWKAKAKQLAERGDLTPADWNNLELFCVNYSMYRKAVEDLASRGFSIVNSQGGESRNPALSAKADAEKIMIKMSSLLGFDPVSRRRNPVETEEEDELDRLE